MDGRAMVLGLLWPLRHGGTWARAKLIVAAVLAVLFCVGRATADQTLPLPAQIMSARSVKVFRMQGVLLTDTGELSKLAERVAASNRAVLGAGARHDLLALVVGETNYRSNLAFVPACGFVASLVFEFDVPLSPPVWWIVTNCGKAVLVEGGQPAAAWDERARFLTREAWARLTRCDESGRWAEDPSCLGQ